MPKAKTHDSWHVSFRPRVLPRVSAFDPNRCLHARQIRKVPGNCIDGSSCGPRVRHLGLVSLAEIALVRPPIGLASRGRVLGWPLLVRPCSPAILASIGRSILDKIGCFLPTVGGVFVCQQRTEWVLVSKTSGNYNCKYIFKTVVFRSPTSIHSFILLPEWINHTYNRRIDGIFTSLFANCLELACQFQNQLVLSPIGLAFHQLAGLGFRNPFLEILNVFDAGTSLQFFL